MSLQALKEVSKGLSIKDALLIKFTAETRTSGVNLADGKQIRKGAYDAIKKVA